jgi:hypothetical protein
LAGCVWNGLYIYRNRLSFGIAAGLFAYDGERVASKMDRTPWAFEEFIEARFPAAL